MVLVLSVTNRLYLIKNVRETFIIKTKYAATITFSVSEIRSGVNTHLFFSLSLGDAAELPPSFSVHKRSGDDVYTILPLASSLA